MQNGHDVIRFPRSPPPIALKARQSYMQVCYQSQMNGLWRFAAPFSFSRLSQHREPFRPPIRQGKSEMPTGTVKFFNADKGYGFIQPESGGQDAFVHISAVEKAGLSTLDRDQRVSYELETDRRGKTSAVNIQTA
jgi:CspA family cold shock protein